MFTTTLNQDHANLPLLKASIDILVDPRDGNATNLAVIHIAVPAGTVMPPHHHGASEAVLIPIEGELVVIDAEGHEERVGNGSVTVIGALEKVGIENRAQTAARVLVCFAPPSFVEAISPRAADGAKA